MKPVLNHNSYGDPGKPGLVMLHGFMGCGRVFRSIADALSPVVHTLAFDLPGHGQSKFAERPVLSQLVAFADVAALVLRDLDRLGIERFYLYGYSMGGRLAQNICILAPLRVKHLVLESSAFGIGNPEQREQRYRHDRHLLDDIQDTDAFRKFLEVWYASPLFASLRGTCLLDNIIRARLDNQVSELQRAIEIMSVGNHPCFARQLACSGVPITFLTGRSDQKYQRIAADAFEKLPDMQIHTFENASHNIHAQFPGQIVETLMRIIGNAHPT